MAKSVIKCINNVARVINTDPMMQDRLKLVFFPDYNVSAMELICPATELSQQISTAGMEASGTGNMKLALNGALTIGTLDGANIEIKEAVGEENIFIFGLTADEVEERLTTGSDQPWELYRTDPDLAAVLDTLQTGEFVGADRDPVRGVWSSLMEHGDRYMLLADFRSYVDTQERAAEIFKDRRAWARATILNIAAMGYFSSDRAILEYAEKIWGLEAVAVKTPEGG